MENGLKLFGDKIMAFITNLTAATPVTGSLVGGQPSGVDNDKGSIIYAGNSYDSSKWGNINVGNSGNPESITIVSGTVGVTGLSTLASFNQGEQMIMRVDSDVAGNTNNAFKFGASNSSNNNNTPNQMDVVKTKYYKTAIRANKWNEATASFDSGYPEVGNTGAWDISVGVDTAGTLIASGTDAAANPTSSEPGKLTYLQGGPNPNNDTYKARYLN